MSTFRAPEAVLLCKGGCSSSHVKRLHQGAESAAELHPASCRGASSQRPGGSPGGTPPPDPEGPDFKAARKQSRDSFADAGQPGPEPVDAGKVGSLQSGVNVLGGTPIKDQSERMTQGSQLHR